MFESLIILLFLDEDSTKNQILGATSGSRHGMIKSKEAIRTSVFRVLEN